jgi:hypothetical protein
LQQALAEVPHLSIDFIRKTLPTKYEEGLKLYLDGLRKAGLPE